MAAKKYLTQRMHSLTHSLIFMAVDIKISFFLRVFYHPLKNKKPVRKSVGIISAMQQSVEQVVGKVTKYAEENPIVVGGTAVTAVLSSLFLFRQASMKRDGNDYNSQVTGGLKILNNADHTLQRNEFESSINDYEGMFR
jgi:hypothetical protein